MRYTYETPLDCHGKESTTVLLRSDGAYIPTDPANTDYQQYLRWLEDPNADEFTKGTGVVTNGDN